MPLLDIYYIEKIKNIKNKSTSILCLIKEFGYFCSYNELLCKQIKAERSKWHSSQVITSKLGNSPKVLIIRN